MKRAAIVSLALVLSAACTPRGGSVVRVVDGQPESGRFITVRAYEAYARGAYLEAKGELREASMAYRQAARSDPESPEIWTRIGALACREPGRSPAAAFARASELDTEYAPLFYERARCHLARDRPRKAVARAERALALDPNRAETSILLASALESAGRRDDARRVLQALVTRDPDYRRGWAALEDFSRRHGDRDQVARARSVLVRSGRARGDAIEALDEALRHGDLLLARERAHAIRLPSAHLAVRAAALGAADPADEQARLVLAADPSSSDARIAALVAADLRRNDEEFVQALANLDQEPMAPSPLAARLMAELLSRRVGRSAGGAWLEAFGTLAEPADALEKSVADRWDRAGVQ